MFKKLSGVTLVAVALTVAGNSAVAQTGTNQSAQNSDAVQPNSPLKSQGMPDTGQFNPAGAASGAASAAAPMGASPTSQPSSGMAPAAPAQRPTRAPRADRG